jgi:hypothetical protein
MVDSRVVGNPSVTRPNGQRRVRCGLPVIRPEPRNLESLASPLFGECVGDLTLTDTCLREIMSCLPTSQRSG